MIGPPRALDQGRHRDRRRATRSRPRTSPRTPAPRSAQGAEGGPVRRQAAQEPVEQAAQARAPRRNRGNPGQGSPGPRADRGAGHGQGYDHMSTSGTAKRTAPVAGRVRPDHPHAVARGDRRDLRRRHGRDRRARHRDAVGLGDRRHPRRRPRGPDRPRAHADAHRRRLLALHVPVRPGDELRDADRVPRLPGHRLRRRVGASARCWSPSWSGRSRAAGARRDPERVGGRLGARRRRLHDRVRAGRETSRAGAYR